MPLTAADTPTKATHETWAATTRRLRAFVAPRVAASDADDITQDILIRILKSGRDAEETAATPAWLYTVARNAVIDHYRTKRILDRLPNDLDQWAESPPDTGPSRAVQEVANCLRPAVNSLHEPYRRAVTLVDLDGMTQTAAATLEGVSVSGMKSRVQRGRRQLATILQRWCAVHLDQRGAISKSQDIGCTDCSCCEPPSQP